MIGSGMPISQSSAPLSKPMSASCMMEFYALIGCDMVDGVGRCLRRNEKVRHAVLIGWFTNLPVRCVKQTGNTMFTITECRIKAEQKFAKAESNPRRKRHFTAAAEAWLFLAHQLEDVDAAMLCIRTIAAAT